MPNVDVLFNRVALIILTDEETNSEGVDQTLDYSIGQVIAYGDDCPTQLKNIGTKVVFDQEDAILVSVNDQDVVILEDKNVLLILK